MKNSSSLDPHFSTAALEYYNNGYSYYKSGDWIRASKAFSESTKLNPNHADSHLYQGKVSYNLALTYPASKEHHINKAIRSFKTALTLNPSPEAYYRLGIILHISGRNYEALHNFRESIALDKNYVQSYCGTAISLFHLANKKDQDKILPLLNRAIETKPNFALAHYYKGRVLWQMDSHEKAADSFTQALEIQLGFINTSKHIPSVFPLTPVIECYTALIKNGQNAATAYYGRGLVSFIHGNHTDALSDFKSAVALAPLFEEKTSPYREKLLDNALDNFLDGALDNSHQILPADGNLTRPISPSSALLEAQPTNKMQRRVHFL